MAELAPTERLLPCLLDRLTDEHPESAKEGRDERVVSLRRYQRAVRRDLEWLMNTGAHPARDGLDEFSEVPRSVLNFGVPDLCGLTASGLRSEELERQLLEAIRTFEPRIMPGSLSINVNATYGLMDHNAISFEIRGDLWAQPIPDRLYLRTDVDLETGQCQITDGANG